MKSKGITLIALVITIVVLIILAGVILNLSLGENGIFNKAKYATESYANEQEREELEIGKIPNEIDSHVEGSRDTVTISKEEYEALVKKGKWELLATSISTTESSQEVIDIEQFTSFVLISYSSDLTSILSSVEISRELFKKGSKIYSNYNGSVPRTVAAQYLDNTHIKVWLVTGAYKAEFYGIY